MRCIWQMDGDKVKGFKCDFSPVDMLMIISGLKYIVADIERHPKDRERAQGIYNQIMLCRYHDEADHKTEPSVSEIPTSSEKPNNCELQTIRCPKCGRTDYIRDMEKDMGIKGSHYKYKCINCNTYIKDEPTISKMEQVDKDINVRSKDCETCKWGEWYRKGYDITMMSDECGGCCSWNSKWTPKDEPQTEREGE